MKLSAHPRLVAGLLLALVGGAGFAGGIVTERLLLAPRHAPRAAAVAAPGEGMRVLIRGQDSAGFGPERRFRMMLPGRLAEMLDLSPEQRARIEQILAEDQAAIRQITEEMEPVLFEVIEQSRRRIHEVLTDEQVARWQESAPLRLRRGFPQRPPE